MKYNSANYKDITVREIPGKNKDRSIKNYDRERLYSDKEVLCQEFSINGPRLRRELVLEFKYSSKSERIYLHELEAAIYREDEWVPLKTEIDKNIIKVTVPRDYSYYVPFNIGFIVNRFHYSEYTAFLANTFPLWTDIKRYKASNGQHFLNYFGIKIEEIFEWIRWVSGEKYLKTADVGQPFKLYQYDIPSEYINIEGVTYHLPDGFEIKESTSTRKFFEPSCSYNYLIDREKKCLYMKEHTHELFLISGEDGEIISPKPFYLWNTFDEFGLLLDLPRRYGESNEDYKERLYDVFRYPSGAHRSGIQFAVAKEFDMLHKWTWEDDSRPFIVPRGKEQLNPHTIRVDYQSLELSQYEVLGNGDVLIHPMTNFEGLEEEAILQKGKERVVGFVNDVAIYELFREEDIESLKKVYRWDGRYESKINAITERVQEISPIMWGYAKWDRNFWDTLDTNISGVGFLPTYYDSDITIWNNQSIKERRGLLDEKY